MEKEKTSNKTWLWILIGVAVVIAIFFIINSNKTNGPTCNSPYILVGSSCCLDQNHNNICDNDEQQQTQNTQPTGPYCGDGVCNGNEKAPDCNDCNINVRLENVRYEILKPTGQYKEFYISNYDVIQLGDKAVLYPGHDLYTGYSQQQCASKQSMMLLKEDFDCPGGCYFVVDSDKRGMKYTYMSEYNNGFQVEDPYHENPLCMYFVFHLKPYPESGVGAYNSPAPVATWESPLINL